MPDSVLEFEFHPLADLFPMLEGDELQALADDIKEHGQRVPIVLHERKILDGRNRYRACQMAEIEPELVDYDGTDALSFVVSLNWKRRHLSIGQRAMVAASIANMRQGERTDVEPSATLRKVSQTDAADLVNVSPRSVMERPNGSTFSKCSGQPPERRNSSPMSRSIK